MIGIIWGLCFRISIVPFVILALFLLYILKISDKKIKFIKYLKVFLSKQIIIIILISSIISNTIILFQNYKYDNLYKNIQIAKFTATVVSDEARKEYKSVYTIKVENINNNSKYKNTKLILNIKEEGILEYGDKISFTGEYQKPQTARNKGGFDYSEYLKTIVVYGTVKTDKNSISILKENNLNIISSLANKCKNAMTNQCDKILKKENAKLLQGILLGQVTDMEEETIEDFRDSSLYHMLAVSGAHVIYIVIACEFLLRKVPNRLANTITILVLIFFMFVTGFSLSVVRACSMGIMLIASKIFYRKSDFINNISLALLLILINNPYSIKSLSVLLSFGGTIGIVAYCKRKKTEGLEIKQNVFQKALIKIKSYMKESLITTISAQIVVAPILLISFNTISLTFFISNVLAGIIIGPITILGFITIFLSFLSIKLSSILAVFLNVLLSILKLIAKLTSRLPFSNIYVTSIPIIFILIYYAVIITINLYKRIQIKENKRITEIKFINKLQKINWKKLIIITLIGIIIFNLLQSVTRKFTMYFIDVGQGDSCLIITKTNKKILIDGGGSDFSSFDVGKKTLLPYLLKRGVRTLDCILVSHFDADHCAGVLTILEELNVKLVVISKQGEISENYEKFLEITKQKNIKVKVVKAKDKINIDKDTYFEILWPQEKQIHENILNNNSIVAKLVYKNFSCLFTGDIEALAEKEIVNMQEKSKLKSTILKVAHHGSKSSTIQEFLELVKPKIALIGVGANNKFGHPNENVIKRLEKLNCKVYRTDENGEIIIKVNSKGRIWTNKMLN